jgi:hypothetical protein
MEPSVLEDAEAWSAPPARLGGETKDVIPGVARVSEVSLDVERWLVIEPAIPHLGSLAFGGTGGQHAETAVLDG